MSGSGPASAKTIAAALLAVAAAGSCTPSPDVVMIYPEGSDAARKVFTVEYSRQLTTPDNFVMRPDEFGGVAVDHERGLLYVGTRDAFLFALEQSTGDVLWDHGFGDSVSSVPALVELPPDGDDPGGELVIVGTDNGVLHALDVQSREARWSYETPGRIGNTPIVADGVVYFSNSRDQIYALDVRTGEWRWQYEQEFSHEFTVHGRGGVVYVPAPQDELAGEAGRIYTGFDNGRVAALGASSGEPLWLANIAPAVGGDFVDCDSTPWIDAEHGVVVVAGQTTGVHGLSLEDGSMVWRYPVEGAANVVGGPDGSLVAASSLAGVFALDSSGALLWRTEVDPGVLRGPVVVDDTVFVTHADRGLLVFDAVTGELLAQLRTGSGTSSPPSYDPVAQRLYMTTNRGVFVALRVGE